MARLYDSHGTLLGGLNSAATTAPPSLRSSTPVSARAECSYGSPDFAYRVTPLEMQAARHRPHLRECHKLVEKRSERHHCKDCGGNYCAAHAAPEAHDCALLMPQPF